MNDMSKLMSTQELRSQLMQSLSSTGLLSLGMVPSAFVPVEVGGHLCEAAFISASRPDKEGCVGRPNEWFITDSAMGKLVLFSLCQAHDFMDTKQYPLNSRVCIVNGTPAQAAENGKALLDAYNQIRSFAFVRELDTAQKQALQQFNNAFERGIAPALKPYYKGLSPAFFQWMSEVC